MKNLTDKLTLTIMEDIDWKTWRQYPSIQPNMPGYKEPAWVTIYSAVEIVSQRRLEWISDQIKEHLEKMS